MAVIELVHRYFVWGERCENRYHFVTDVDGTPYSGFAQAMCIYFRDSIAGSLDNWLTNQGGIAASQDIVARSLYDDSDFGELIGTPFAPSRAAGQSNPSNWVVSARSPRLRTGWNRAYKRYSGIGENDVSGNTPLAAWVSGFNAFLDFLCGGHTLVNAPNPNVDFDYRMLRYRIVINPTSGKEEYVPQTTEIAQKVASVVVPDMQVYQLTSQATRMPGRGS